MSSVPNENAIHEDHAPWLSCHVSVEPQVAQNVRLTLSEEW